MPSYSNKKRTNVSLSAKNPKIESEASDPQSLQKEEQSECSASPLPEHPETRFFAQFDKDTLLKHWSSSNTLLEMAQKLGFSGADGLSRCDYDYIHAFKDRAVWRELVKFEPDRKNYVLNLSAEELQQAQAYPGIETLSSLGLHFMLSPRHGRDLIRAQLQKHKIPVKAALHKGVYGVSEKPLYWPTRFYEKRVGEKPKVCPICGFQAIHPEQIELDHTQDPAHGKRNARNKSYYTDPTVEPKCANCHTLKHRTGEPLQNKCGAWHLQLPKLRKYQCPDDIFCQNCPETRQLQKNYYLKWHLTGPTDYKCACCGVSKWGPNQQLLSLELHHIDNNNTNSCLSNLQLLCPNCHRAQRPSAA
uniref:Putative HNH homing endonuclease n=1 Tax=Hafniomonas laevis TaxID=436124 RepID=A0A0S2LP10_9CHLO|nr:putative HNH homing endonuclease [Hafniomonas laevis]ALO63092.1 putative HNH homing endonuclease [Hafniomonas laevis]